MSDGKLIVSFDGAWQKRGTGHAYNSLTDTCTTWSIDTGHATLFGKNTKKCVRYAVKGKRCRICDVAKKKRMRPRKHDCSHNWFGSAKPMEPAMVCEMIQSIYDDGAKVDTLVMFHNYCLVKSKQADKNNA